MLWVTVMFVHETIRITKLSHCAMVVKIIDMHTSGGSVRIIVSGYPEVTGDKILD